MSSRNTEAAIVREEGEPFELETVELDEPRSDEVLIQVAGVGICHTDLSVRDQHLPTPLPAVLGHEGAGVVEATGSDVSKVEPGDRVVMSFTYDNTCPNCASGDVAYCENWQAYNFAGQRLSDGSTPIRDSDGEPIHGMFFGQSSFATHAVATEQSVVPVSDDIPLEMLGPLGCGIMTGAGGVLNTLEPATGSSIVVFGTGSVGLSAVMAANVAGCSDIIAVDLEDSRLEKANSLGATHTLNPQSVDDVVDAIQEELDGGAQHSLEVTGQPEVLQQAVDVLRPTGTCGVIGAPPLGTEVSLDVNHLLSGRTVTGVTMGAASPEEFIPELINLYRDGEFPFDELITYYDFEDIEQAVQDHENGETIKPVLKVNEV